MTSIRHVLPGYGYFPDDPARSPLSGIVSVVYHLARETTRAGLQTSVYSFSNGRDRLRTSTDGITVRRVRHRRWLTLPRVDLSYAGPVAVLGMRHPVDILHVHSNPYLLHPQRAGRRILHFHTPDFSPLPAYRRAVTRADAIVFCSAALRERFVAVVGEVPPPSHVIPNGVLLERFLDTDAAGTAFRRGRGIRDDEFVVLFAGSIVPEKGPHVLLEAVRRARNRSSRPVRLVVVGSSALWQSAGHQAGASDYERDLIRHADPDWVTFVGPLAQTEMPAAYAACDLLACPSIWPEPYALVIVEAMASGKAVVASRVGGIPELVQDGVTGILVEPDSAAALAEAIVACADDRERCRDFGAAGRRRAQGRAWDRIIDQFWMVYGFERDRPTSDQVDLVPDSASRRVPIDG